MKQTFRFNSISEFHAFCNLPNPEHPLISLIDYSKVQYPVNDTELKWIQNFYSVGLKRNINAKFNYGQQEYDFKEGVLLFIAPGQVFSIEGNSELQHTGYSLLIHPDFLWNTPLAQKIKQYEYSRFCIQGRLRITCKTERDFDQYIRI